ncbi:putative lipoxygenase 8, chloroplastic [Canna indica]|uniref:Lipoxygenase n=1 Tax=Canna indica TaxID=4628 RepID=A0AAQ3QQ53_9LILI|nr:putative lipoxygenase 8, chloroplastic [Canna indica]
MLKSKRSTGRPRSICCSSSSGVQETANRPAPQVETDDTGVASSTVKATATVKVTDTCVLLPLGLDDVKDWFGKTVLLELVSTELDAKTIKEKDTIKAYARKASQDGDTIEYEATFEVPRDFGDIGGVFITNDHDKEMFLSEIKLESSNKKNELTITCKSWVHTKSNNPDRRLFFFDKSYLPAQTPDGLRRLREKELETVRGDGQGERKEFERIYDYDVYNDLGNPDTDENLARPVLGGSKQYPYPRRCRTGRPKSEKDPESESRASSFYIPRDEAFSPVKQNDFLTKTFQSVLGAVVPAVQSALLDINLGFPSFAAVDDLFKEGVTVAPTLQGTLGFLRGLLFRSINLITGADGIPNVLQFTVPDMLERDRFAWLRDEEFARQTLAGVNPYAIELLKVITDQCELEFPIVSKLDPQIYGPPESAITAQLIEEEIKGSMTVQKAIEDKRLFILDYHDLYLPFVHKVREQEHTTLYGSRTIFFLTDDGTLKPVAIELTRPASETESQWKEVFRPCSFATGAWLWRHAISHVRAHDSGHHELVSHWLRTHCCVEPYIIAAHRQLSQMHPIFRLLHPHFRYNMDINSKARQSLINAGGIIEVSFSPLKYSMEISSVAYDLLWRFDMEALPTDLIRRGLAVEDPTAEHGLRLTIEDYPFANDGLLIWSAIEQWVQDYVSYYYPNASGMVDDVELQEWWDEVRTKGHGDKKDEPWWPKLNTIESLTRTLTTIIWVASAHHAAVNFGQYSFGGYFPNRPSIARTNMPTENMDRASYVDFLKNPEDSLLESFPSQFQATVVMAVLDVLSNHSVDEQYIGGEPEAAWVKDPAIRAAFERFSGRVKEIEGIIDGRNCDQKLKNRYGAGVVPYELMKPFSQPGVTGMGIPNSISI